MPTAGSPHVCLGDATPPPTSATTSATTAVILRNAGVGEGVLTTMTDTAADPLGNVGTSIAKQMVGKF